MKRSDIILMDKEEGITSFSSLNPLKKAYGKGVKIGHAGTLDKFASGLMIVLVGNATRLNPVFSSFDKSYIATIRFGIETDTLDPEGSIVKTSDIPSESDVDYALSKIMGESMQTPPVYSAVHINGKRAYAEARKNRDVVMPERKIIVYEAKKLSYDDGLLVARFHVSKGTYIRALARDIAYSVGKVAHLTALRRVSIGPYSLEDIGKYDMKALLDKTELFSTIQLDPERRKEIVNGKIEKSAILSDSDSNKNFKFLCFSNELYAIASIAESRIRVIARMEDEGI